MGASLPPALMRHLPDAEVEVVSWSAASGELVLRVRRELGSESGLLRFAGVGLVHLPPRLTITGLTASEQADGDTLFAVEGAWGESYSVVAASVAYAPDAEPGAAPDRRGT